MEITKLKKIFKLLLIALIILLIFALYFLPKAKENELTNKGEAGGTTDTIFQASQYDNGKLVQDYLNPTDDERYKINRLYGVGNSYFAEDGLHLTLPYDNNMERLITDVWPNNEFTKDIVKPDMELWELEMCEKFLEIQVVNVTKRDMKKYIDSIKEEYDVTFETKKANILFLARNADYRVVTVEYDEDTDKGIIKYDF